MADKPGFGKRIGLYFEDVQKEFRKVTFPERKELMASTYVTIGATVIFTLFVYFVDMLLTFVMSNLY
jgi:preprotein translocase subunit SecE